MSVLNRKLRRDLLQARGLLAAIVVIIAVGILCLVALRSSYWNLQHARNDYYAQCRMADFSVHFKKAPLAHALSVADTRGISQLQTRIVFEVTVDVEGEPRPLSGRVVSLPDSPRPILNDIVLRSGGYFTPYGRDEVIVNDAFARAHDLKPGDTVKLILNNRKQELLIVGTAISSEFVYLILPGEIAPVTDRYGVFFVKESFAEDVFDFDGACNQLLGLLDTDHRHNPKAVLDEIERRLDAFGVSGTTPLAQQTSNRTLTEEINGLRAFALFLPTIFLAVAALVLNILMTRVAEQQRTIVGTLKALGHSNAAVAWHFIKYALAVGTMGGLLGLLLGNGLAALMTDLYRSLFEFPRLDTRIYPGVMAIGMLVAIAFSLLGTWRGIANIARLTPAEAMRPRAPAVGGTVILERWRWLWLRLGFKAHLVLRNLLRNKMRSFIGAFAASMGAALILLTFYAFDGMDYLIDYQFERVMLSDVDLTLKDDRDHGALLEARRLPGVALAEPVFAVPCRLENGRFERKFAVMGLLPDAQLTRPHRADGSPVVIPESGLLLTAKLAEILHVEPGKTLDVIPVRGQREPRKAVVAGIADTFIGLGAYANYDYLNNLVGETGAVSMVQLELMQDPELVQEFYAAVKELPAVQTVSANADKRENLERIIKDTSSFSITALLIFAGTIFAASILTASLISLSERQREVATFRAMGYQPAEIGGIFLGESLVVNFAGALMGIPIGYLLMIWMVHAYDTELYRLPVFMRPMSIVWTVLLATFFTVLAHPIVHRLIVKMNWREALSVKE